MSSSSSPAPSDSGDSDVIRVIDDTGMGERTVKELVYQALLDLTLGVTEGTVMNYVLHRYHSTEDDIVGKIRHCLSNCISSRALHQKQVVGGESFYLLNNVDAAHDYINMKVRRRREMSTPPQPSKKGKKTPVKKTPMKKAPAKKGRK